MIGRVTLGKQVLSDITLALFEDTGLVLNITQQFTITHIFAHIHTLTYINAPFHRWYQVDYSMADKFAYGKNRGCDFIKKSCNEYMSLKKKQLV